MESDRVSIKNHAECGQDRSTFQIHSWLKEEGSSKVTYFYIGVNYS